MDIQKDNAGKCPFCGATTFFWESANLVCLDCCGKAVDGEGNPHVVKYKWDEDVGSSSCLPWRIFINDRECYRHYFLGICITILVEEAPDFVTTLCED